MDRNIILKQVFIIPLISFDMNFEYEIDKLPKENTCVLYFSFGDFLNDYKIIKQLRSKYDIEINFIKCDKILTSYIDFGTRYKIKYDVKNKQIKIMNDIIDDIIINNFSDFDVKTFYFKL